jgi:hypothetical protein
MTDDEFLRDLERDFNNALRKAGMMPPPPTNDKKQPRLDTSLTGVGFLKRPTSAMRRPKFLPGQKTIF